MRWHLKHRADVWKSDAAVSPLWGLAGLTKMLIPDPWWWSLCHRLAWIQRAVADGDVINKVHSLYIVQWTTFRACYWFAALPRLLVSSQRQGRKKQRRWWIVAFVTNISQFPPSLIFSRWTKQNKISSYEEKKTQHVSCFSILPYSSLILLVHAVSLKLFNTNSSITLYMAPL